MKDKAETLRLFLETANFRELRAEAEAHLQRGERVRFVIYLGNGLIKYDLHTQVQPHK